MMKHQKIEKEDVWKVCNHIVDQTAKSAIISPEIIAVCRPCAMSGIKELRSLNKNQLVEKLIKVDEVLNIEALYPPQKIPKAEIHPCNACDKNKTNIVLMSVDAAVICKDLKNCPYFRNFPGRSARGSNF